MQHLALVEHELTRATAQTRYSALKGEAGNMTEAGVSLPIRVVEEISARLSRLKDLRLPYQLQNNADVSQAQKEQYLQALLLRDPGMHQY